MCVYTAFWQELQPLRLEQVGVSMALIWEFFSCHDFSQIAQTEVAYIKMFIIGLRSQNGQNGQILFISGEQLSLIVAGDSAKTLSVLGNMRGDLDDCGLRFVQKCRRPPQNTPDFGGPTDFFEKLPSKPPPRISPTWPT